MGCDPGHLHRLPSKVSERAGARIALLTADRAARAAAVICALIDEIWLAGPPAPANAAAVVTARDVPLLRVRGAANPARAADSETPFYLASQTKSYVGLLAAALDADGCLPLATTLADIWPGLILPAPADPSRLTMLDLLSHQLPLRNDDLETRNSWEAPVAASDYPAILDGSSVRPPGFEYANLGYLVYAAALETATGVGWSDWLDRRLLVPTGMDRTSARTSAFAPDEIAWRYLMQGGDLVARPPKTDGLMHAAGGLVSSAADLATWLQANLRRDMPGIGGAAFELAHRPVVPAPGAEGPFIWSDYALGWQVGRVGGISVLGHRGGYAGARSIALISPSLGAGIALMVNADFGTRDLLTRLSGTFFKLLAGEMSRHDRR